MLRIVCPRCGRFRWPVALEEARLQEEVALRVSAAVRRATDAGNPLTFESVDQAREVASATPPPLTFSGYFDAVIDCVAQKARSPGRAAKFDNIASSLAASVFLSRDHLMTLLQELKNELLLTVENSPVETVVVRLTPKGWERADAFRRHGRALSRVFVAMWFSEELRPLYSEAILPALESCGYERPFRVDDQEHDETWKISAEDGRRNQKIDDRILGAIRRSRFVVADFTGQRPSVYFEAGFAEGLGIPVIWTCRKDDMTKVSFDTRQNAHLRWEQPEDLRSQLVGQIERRGWRLTPVR